MTNSTKICISIEVVISKNSAKIPISMEISLFNNKYNNWITHQSQDSQRLNNFPKTYLPQSPKTILQIIPWALNNRFQ